MLTVDRPGSVGHIFADALQTNSTRSQRRLALHVLAERADELPGPVAYELADRLIGPKPGNQFLAVLAAQRDLERTQKETCDWTDWHAIQSAIFGREKVLDLALRAAVAGD